ncbi:MAG TPA: ATP synthase F0 subunit B [Terriglobales bacterium]|jgi:F-type H+-transporting ATPase subunit b|nr:ATP synthase F0 subunit B [Terriglobales bacterium]
MEETLRQLSDLLLRSIPTIVLFMVVYAGYYFIVHRPLVRMLTERHDRTEGAIEKARADVAAAEAKAGEYEQRLREAQLAVFKSQESRRQAALQARTEAVHQARNEALARVGEAKAAIERDIDVAKAGLQADAELLAREIIERILAPVAAQTPVGGAQ